MCRPVVCHPMACWIQSWDSCVQQPTEMTEGRKSQVILLDERRLEIMIQPKLYAGELLDLVASHFNLKEKEYFGLSFQDETGHNNWLHLDRKVLEHDFPKKSDPVLLYFSVRFFIESITYLKDNATVELFFLQAKQAIFKGLLECDSDTAFELAAYILQATFGDYTDDETTRLQLRKLPVLPTSALRDHPSISYCEEEVISHYTKLAGQSRGNAIVNYMTIVEGLPTYGIHYYEVKDKSGLPWILGLSYKGVSQYDHNDKKTPRRVFAWKQLENLYFRDKKFSIEVHDPKRILHTLSSFNLYEDAIQEPIEEFDELSDAISDPTTQVSVSRRTFGPGNVNVYAWFASTPQLTKCIWSMAVNQHQFYLDRKQSKTQLPTVRSMTEIAADLSQSMTSLPSSGPSEGISRSNSAHSLSKLSTNSSKLELLEEDPNRAVKQEMYNTLKARKEALEEMMKQKTELLKALCIQEGELTGVLPPETPIAPGEATPQVRRRMGTEFSLSPKVIRNHDQQEEQYLSKLELEFELQDKITKAAQKLALDKTVSKTARKTRKQAYHRAHQKLKSLEKKVNEARRYAGIGSVKAVSSEDMSCDSESYLDSEPEFVSPVGTPAMHRAHKPQPPQSMPRQHHSYPVMADHSPQVEVVEVDRQSTGSSSHSSLPGTTIHRGPGIIQNPSPRGERKYHPGMYQPSAVHTTRTQYRTQMYPTYTSRGGQPQGQYDGDPNNGYLENQNKSIPNYENMPPNPHSRNVQYEQNNGPVQAHNMYNITSQNITRYDSGDELKDNPRVANQVVFSDDESYNRPKYGSLEGHYRNRQREFNEGRFGSLERNRSSPILLPELTPSRFGSKRESTCDHKESVCPYPDGQCQMNNRHPQFYVGDHHSNGSVVGGSYGQDGVSQEHYYPGNMRQQEAPRTPHYQSPPVTYYQDTSLTNGPPNTESPSLKVKTHQGYVEMSKPFEMSDFYKYSERIRKQRVQKQDQYANSARTPQGTQAAPAYSSNPAHRNYPYGSRSGQMSQQSRSRPSSPFSPAGEDSAQKGSDTGVSYSNNVRPQGPYMAQPITQSGYSGTYPSPQSVQLQHPQPMTCEPVTEPITRKKPNRAISEPYLAGNPLDNDDYESERTVNWYKQGQPDRTSTLV